MAENGLTKRILNLETAAGVVDDAPATLSGYFARISRGQPLPDTPGWRALRQRMVDVYQENKAAKARELADGEDGKPPASDEKKGA